MGRRKLKTPNVKLTAHVLKDTDRIIRERKKQHGSLGKVIDHAIRRTK